MEDGDKDDNVVYIPIRQQPSRTCRQKRVAEEERKKTELAKKKKAAKTPKSDSRLIDLFRKRHGGQAAAAGSTVPKDAPFPLYNRASDTRPKRNQIVLWSELLQKLENAPHDHGREYLDELKSSVEGKVFVSRPIDGSAETAKIKRHVVTNQEKQEAVEHAAENGDGPSYGLLGLCCISGKTTKVHAWRDAVHTAQVLCDEVGVTMRNLLESRFLVATTKTEKEGATLALRYMKDLTTWR